ncbi:hypothetical protein, partial [Myroides sp. N17-2]|uniref:hypothetical protein n=1 Tax=Myroides sp. N17-2 TaxID=2030799 RepID=UPI000EFCD37B
TQLTNKEEFINNIINKLQGKYGNVGYDIVKKEFFYYDADDKPVTINWSDLDTTNFSFTIGKDDTGVESLIVTDSKDGKVYLAVADIANNSTFISNLTQNDEFITQLTNKEEFINNIINKLQGKYGNVGYDIDKNEFFYYDKAGRPVKIEWETIVSEAETLTSLKPSNKDDKALLVYTDEDKIENSVDLTEVLKNSTVFEDYLKNYISSISIEETITKLDKIKPGLYEYFNEDAIIKGTAGIQITVTQDVIDTFEEITKDPNVLTIITDIINKTAGDVALTKEGDDIIIKNKAGLKVNLTNEIQDKETKTWLEHIKDKKVEQTPSGDVEYYVHSLKYHGEDSTDQRNNEILISELIQGSETITELDYNLQTGQLIYTDETNTKTIIPLDQLVKQFETKTDITIDQDAKKLIYNAEGGSKEIDLAPIVQEPWLQSGTQSGATNSNQDMYVNGWVGIGYDKPSGAINEKLRVNGSITATNSYYADYVFEKYFTGESALKYDYTFKDLASVESYIKTNRHLPGITPISELSKVESGYSFNVSELSIQLLEKTEELYLHVIEQANKIAELEQQNRELTLVQQELDQVKKDSDNRNETLLLLLQKIEELETTVIELKK